MTRIEEIERAVQDLAREDLREFRRWFQEFDARVWDEELERDVEFCRLDSLADEALEDLRQGRTRSVWRSGRSDTA